ncbi:MAG: hypothetical protein HOH19_03740 [Kordiimonadaceae bacterium]|nr:hypothetical protein [Kordiimonadaceae bacterium]
MRLLILSSILLGMLFSNTVFAQDAAQKAAHEAAINSQIVVDAYSKTVTPSGSLFRDKEFETSSEQWFNGDLEVAKIVFASSPLNESSFSWLGRRHGFMGNYAKSIEVFVPITLFAIP